ncbi:MAG TPA: ribulose-phosphate 3-epimerase [Candidatus Paceibacterota bacterium]|nr:ribulose-phosphate 3-epimerase [Candidatus Paceibacterota bacterium]HRZ34359.1 ribulose-phosphate 3-epimerase [Candidatus Paceibacterota bacterium]
MNPAEKDMPTEKKIEIIPTVMPENHTDFVEKINRIFSFVSTIQIDVMDGKFVPSISWPYNSDNDSDWQKYVNQEEGLPHWDKVDFEIDLMVEDQIAEAKKWISAGVSRVICHVEALKEDGRAEFLKLREDFDVELYLALVPETSLEKLTPYLDDLDGVQFMGINKIGFQGQDFEPKVLDKIRQLRAQKPNLPISVDGGVSFETALQLVAAGATKLASGSLIFESDNPKKTIDELKNLVRSK